MLHAQTHIAARTHCTGHMFRTATVENSFSGQNSRGPKDAQTADCPPLPNATPACRVSRAFHFAVRVRAHVHVAHPWALPVPRSCAGGYLVHAGEINLKRLQKLLDRLKTEFTEKDPPTNRFRPPPPGGLRKQMDKLAQEAQRVRTPELQEGLFKKAVCAPPCATPLSPCPLRGPVGPAWGGLGGPHTQGAHCALCQKSAVFHHR